MAHYHTERNHQGLANRLLRADPTGAPSQSVRRRQRLGGMLNYYHLGCLNAVDSVSGQNGLSAADVLYGTTFAMFGQSPKMPKATVIDDYVHRIVTRPAFERAQARDIG
jgi:hypothetical protein